MLVKLPGNWFRTLNFDSQSFETYWINILKMLLHFFTLFRSLFAILKLKKGKNDYKAIRKGNASILEMVKMSVYKCIDLAKPTPAEIVAFSIYER